jgi:DNA-3-methyladenine glycosylase II
MPTRREHIQLALEHLQSADPVMRRIIERVGPFTLRPERDRFWMLVRSILSQQISTAAARTIRTRVQALVEPDKVTPESILRLSETSLRSAGVSARKVEYMRDLAMRVADGSINLSQIGRLSDDQIIARLVEVRGIGRWTAEMFLMFALGRLNVFPVDDLGIRNAIQAHYEVSSPPSRVEMHAVAEPWRPYASVASWYCWRSLDIAPPDERRKVGYPV